MSIMDDIGEVLAPFTVRRVVIRKKLDDQDKFRVRVLVQDANRKFWVNGSGEDYESAVRDLAGGGLRQTAVRMASQNLLEAPDELF
jgi:hypothetical protein